PLGVLVLGVVVSNVDRYAYGYYYSSDAYTSYSRDLRVLSDRISKMPASAHVTLLAATDEVSFYQAYSKHQRSVASLDVVSASSTVRSGTTIATHTAQHHISAIPTEVVTDKTVHTADRFYLYKNSSH
ncbi:hypothetical protein KBD87_04925, partial [Candidatus Saccharibacteria bacterium]|nr:hypothetical protein [Candidatus Saccharibacteria bacterium]